MTQKEKAKYLGQLIFLAICFIFILVVGTGALMTSHFSIIWVAMAVVFLIAEIVIGAMFAVLFKDFKYRIKNG